jgi:predicted metal-dependent HD superfamily phosphohydrolase
MDDEKFQSLLDDVSSHFRHQKLKEDWYELCKIYKLPNEWATGVYYLMQKLYLLPVGCRHYHTLEGHIYDCITELKDAVVSRRIPKFGFELAYSVFMHDALCYPGSQMNEIESGHLAASLLHGLPFDGHIVQWTILGTLNGLPPFNYVSEREPETLIMCDLDLTSMGKSYEQFCKNSVAIRQEHSEVPDDLFNPQREELLSSLLERGYIYRLPYFKDLYEKQAVENITRFIEEVKG